MGFNDKDLCCPKHDQMSFALVNKKKVAKLLSPILQRIFNEPNTNKRNRFFVKDVSLEYPLCKGENQYKVIVGFLDCLAEVEIETMESRENCDKEWTKKELMICPIEAKPSMPNPMETMRQINTYREYIGNSCRLRTDYCLFIVWCPTANQELVEVFSNEHIFLTTVSLDSLSSDPLENNNATQGR